jgi:3-oxoacyl-[acyl-carrier protein] reductase
VEIRPFKDRCYAVIGATGWVGSILCHKLRVGGAQIAMGARGRERLTLLAREMSAVSQAMDIAKAGDTDVFLNFSLSRMKKLDGVICCIGSPWAPPLQRFSGAEWDQRVAENVQASFMVVQKALPFLEGYGGSIVLLTPVAANTVDANPDVLNSARAGLQGLVHAASLRCKSVRVNAVAPDCETVSSIHTLGSMQAAASVADTIAWLLMPQQAWITGRILDTDGARMLGSD